LEWQQTSQGQVTDHWGRGKSRVTGRSAAGAGTKAAIILRVGRRLFLSPRKAVSGIQVRQSDLASYSRCPQQKKLVDQYKADAGGKQPEQLSMTAYGSVMHHAIHVMEKLHFDKRPDAVEKAHATFDYYWDPANITAICDSVTIWAARQTWAGLARKGHQTIDLYAKYLQTDVSRLLGLELEFNLPFELDGEQHIFHGTMDRLSLRKLSGTPYLNIEDFKTGRNYGTRKGDLRWNAQFSGYCWATTQPKFWTDAWGQEEGAELFTRFSVLARRATWISLKNGVDRQDAGWRGPQDYARFWAAIREYVKAVKADIYPLSLKGDVCFYCAFREGICGGVAVPDEDHGRPEPRPVKA